MNAIIHAVFGRACAPVLFPQLPDDRFSLAVYWKASIYGGMKWFF
jgi:hypothetical protein